MRKFILFTILYVCYITLVNSEFVCPPGKKRAQSNKEILVNGCGPNVTNFWTKVSHNIATFLGKNFESCCNKHDTCYGTCGNNKKTCDSELKFCMKSVCRKKKFFNKAYCYSTSFTFSTFVEKVGSKFFDNSQNSNCICISN